MKDAAAHCRAGKGPVLLEANTYRFRGHSMADPATYRTKKEVEEERKNDPIPRLKAHALKVISGLGEDAFEQIETEVKKVVDDAVKFADESPEPSVDELWKDTIVEEGEPDVDEAERVEWVPVERVRELIRGGEVTDGYSLTALLWFLIQP